MVLRMRKYGVVSGALTVACLVGAQSASLAQEQSTDTVGTVGKTNDPANAKIDLDLESTNLYYGLKLLFSQVRANFTIDESLKSLTVTAHLTGVPFRVALETLLKSTSAPLTYKVENGIYSVVPKVEEVQNQPVQEPVESLPRLGGGYKYGIIRPSNTSAFDIVSAFGGTLVYVGYDKTSYGNGGMGGNRSNGMSSGSGSSGFGSGGFGSGGMGSSSSLGGGSGLSGGFSSSSSLGGGRGGF